MNTYSEKIKNMVLANLRVSSKWKKGRFESFAIRYLQELGFQVFTKGWPDLLAVGGGRTIAIELKQGSDSVKPHQKAMHAALNEAGLETVTFRGNFTSHSGDRAWRRDNRPWLDKILRKFVHPEEFDGAGIA